MPPRRTSTPAAPPRAPPAPTPTSAPPAADVSRTSRTTYVSTPVPQQVYFPTRRKVVKTYGGRRSLAGTLAGSAAGTAAMAGNDRRRRSLRQQTLTQIEYVRSSSSSGLLGDDKDDETEEEGEDVGVEETDEGDVLTAWEAGARAAAAESKAEVAVERRRASKMRKTRKSIPSLERKASSFHTQTLTQFLGSSKAAEGELRVDDEEEDAERQLPLPGGSPSLVKQPSVPKSGEKGKMPRPADPRTPSHKRIKVDLDEVPSSQPTPFTPMLDRYSPHPRDRSPLTQKSTNHGAPTPTARSTTAKRPRDLIIQDSYNTGSSEGFLLATSQAEEERKMEGNEKRSQKARREPLAEIPVASLELGEATSSQRPARRPLAEIPVASLELPGTSPSSRETPMTRRKRLFIEIPDSDDELESIGSTPLGAGARSTQQTPVKRKLVDEDFQVHGDPGSSSASRAPSAALPGIPHLYSGASSSRSDKENQDPGAIDVWKDGDSTASEGVEPGTPTPTTRAQSSQIIRGAGGASQSSAKTASQFWEVTGKCTPDDGELAWTAAEPSTALAPSKESASEEEGPSTPTPAPRGLTSQNHDRKHELNQRFFKATPGLDGAEKPTASDGEEGHVPSSTSQDTTSLTVQQVEGRKQKSTPEIPTSESSGAGEPATPTPVVRRVQIALPPPSTDEEVYKETPRKAQKSSPIQQRHTQARLQYYSQWLESQRIPLEVIRSLGPQTDRSDILVSIHPEIVDEIVSGVRDHEFRSYKFPVQVSRCWIYTTRPVSEVQYMATLGPPREPGQIDSLSGLGNAEFNAGTLGHKYAHKLLQVYQLNNPVPLADMADNGLGDEPPHKYRYLPPAVVGQLLANLRCALFADEGEEDGEEVEEDEHGEGGVTISQELEKQLRSDIIHSTQLMSSERRYRRKDGEDVIPASQSPVKKRSGTPMRSSQRLRSRHCSQQKRQHGRTPSATHRTGAVCPSQATTASDISRPASRAGSSSPVQRSSAPASVPRPPLPGSSGPSLPESGDMDDGSLLPLPPVGSSQAGLLLPPDSLLLDEVRMAPPPLEVWDSEEE